ncbi:MAG TPA: MmgE/PrpD family protein [Candidatus Krumholzibacteria bacterium]|nr:MmgE/PrpD family protein [Candidatus Krumholzibacteria bacterium]
MSDTVTATMARWAAGLRFDDIPPEVLHQAKRFLLDSVGCAFGGFLQEDCGIALDVLAECAGTGECTVLASGEKADPVSATLANALMIRSMDYNDIYWRQDPVHPSDVIPAAMAACERQDLDARDLLLGVVLGHEFEMRLAEAAFPGIRERGWHHATLTAVVSPIVAGRLLGLDTERIQHAIGIAASHNATFGAVTAGELTMTKNSVDPMATQSGMTAALLAERGYTGPRHVIDGKEGLVHCLGPEWDLDVLTDGLGETWRIERCGMKAFPTEALTHAPISATLDIVRDNDLAPDEIESVLVRTTARAADILADPSKYDPQSKETADHSLPYVIAAVLVDRNVTPAQFTPERIADPVLRAQLGKVEVMPDPDVEAVFPELQQAVVRIRTKDGREFSEKLDHPKGDPRNPLSDHEIEAKFDALSDPVLSEIARKRVKETVWMLDDFGSARNFMSLCQRDRS